jgi:four helix bundle protein
MQDFRNVEAWRKAHALVLSVYAETRAMPREEMFGVTMQLRRGAAAIATRIAEGTGRSSDAEFAGDLRKAASGCNELEYLFVLTRDLGYWNAELCDSRVTEVVAVRMLIYGLLRKL